ncbi:hypothetical protein ACWC83_37230, partial [Streptomyces goshikiensis]
MPTSTPPGPVKRGSGRRAGRPSKPKPDAKVGAPTSAPQSSTAPEALSSAAAAAGIPPSPAPEQRTIYLAALNKIDPEIVNGKDDKAI